jgi:hypothetical protein
MSQGFDNASGFRCFDVLDLAVYARDNIVTVAILIGR